MTLVIFALFSFGFHITLLLYVITKIKLMTVCCVDYSEHGGCRLWVSLCQVRREESSRSERTSGTNCFVLELELKGVELRSSCFRHPTPLCTPVSLEVVHHLSIDIM